jgi:hypothetical protein
VPKNTFTLQALANGFHRLLSVVPIVLVTGVFGIAAVVGCRVPAHHIEIGHTIAYEDILGQIEGVKAYCLIVLGIALPLWTALTAYARLTNDAGLAPIRSRKRTTVFLAGTAAFTNVFLDDPTWLLDTTTTIGWLVTMIIVAVKAR